MITNSKDNHETVSQEKDVGSVKCVNDQKLVFWLDLRSDPLASRVEADGRRCPKLGVAYNAHVLGAILTHVAPAMGWR